MFDIKAIRKDPEEFNKAWARRGLSSQTPELLKLDEAIRAIKTGLQELQAKRNEESKKIGEIKKAGGDAQVQMDLVAKIKVQISDLESQAHMKQELLDEILSSLPNMMQDDVPDGENEDQNVELHKWGVIKSESGPDHVEIGEKLGLIDFETAAKMSGARFVLLKGAIARMERALAQFFLDTHVDEHGYVETSPPLMVKDSALYGTGQLPKFKDDLYKLHDQSRIFNDPEDADKFLQFINSVRPIEKYPSIVENLVDFFGDHEFYQKLSSESKGKSFNDRKGISFSGNKWLIPTSEVSLTNIVAEMIVDEESLPRRYTAFTPCFRSEAGSAGRDTRGMLRQHQFYKVEMVGVTTPEESDNEHQRMLDCAENVLKKLDIPFRTVVLCSGDTGFGATKTYDIEAWLPGQEAYREISSVSNCMDFQARRMNARCRPKGEKATRYVHTLNGSGVAVGRALIAVIENYWDGEGIVVPDVLKPYMGGIEKIV